MNHALPWSPIPLSPFMSMAALCLCGAMGALALPPFNFWPAMAVPLSAFALVLISEMPVKRFARDAFLIGLGYFIAGLWWLGVAFLVEPDQFAWALPLGVVGLPAILALFPLAGMLLARGLMRASLSPWLALIVGLGGAEWLRGFLFTGFPWNSFGMAFASDARLMQTAAIVGQNGLDLIVIAVGSSLAFFLVSRRVQQIVISTAVMIAMFAFGHVRLMTAETENVDTIRLRVMQPDVPLDDKFSSDTAAEIMNSYLTLSTKGSYPSADGMAGITHLVWPETAFPFLLDESDEARAQIASILPVGGALITGAVRRERDGSGQSRFFNSVLVMDQTAAIVGRADKVHLVPFGEYLPLAGLLEKWGIRQFVNAPGGFAAGSQRVMLNTPSLPLFVPLICYEIIFSGEVLAKSSERPAFLLNVTNDGWFGLTPGPAQHFALARLRTVEEGLPLVRSANTGISAVVDPYGRIRTMLALGERGVIDSDLPAASDRTVFSRVPYLGWLLILIAVSVQVIVKLPLRQLTRKSA